MQRHLPECARCRAAVVASAAGVRGPGDTVVLTRPGLRKSSPARTAFKVASVAGSVLLVGAAWFYGSALSNAPPPAAPSFTPPPSATASPPRAEPPTLTPPADTASSTREVAAALQPADAPPQVQARLLIEPSSNVGSTAPSTNAPPPEPTAEPVATTERAEPLIEADTDDRAAITGSARAPSAAHAGSRSKRPPAKKPTRSSSRPKSSDLPTEAEAEGTDRFGLEW